MNESPGHCLLLSVAFGSPMHFLLMTSQAVLTPKALRAFIALGTHRGIPSALGPCSVLLPNVTVLRLRIPSTSPAAILFGTAAMRLGVFFHFDAVGLSMVTALPRAQHAGFRAFWGRGWSRMDRSTLRRGLCSVESI